MEGDGEVNDNTVTTDRIDEGYKTLPGCTQCNHPLKQKLSQKDVAPPKKHTKDSFAMMVQGAAGQHQLSLFDTRLLQRYGPPPPRLQ
mmetsp:Transcript_20726/g.33668  ORF Transcript_20726/g.33668 Transcript_20726/m.33668 type:complete len:87 (+) Transcript_20726:56-316(+)